MSAQHQRSRSKPSAIAEIESMIAMGKTGAEIMAATGRSRSWVSQVMGYHPRKPRGEVQTGDCAAHIAQIAAANKKMCFPFYPALIAGYRMPA